jgi:hypothetical protein
MGDKMRKKELPKKFDRYKNIKYEREIQTNTIGEEYDVGKLKQELEKYDTWLLGNHLMARPFMNVRLDLLYSFKKTIDNEIPFYYLDSCHWIEDSHSEKDLYATFFRFILGAEQWKKNILHDDGRNKYEKYRRELSFEDVFGYKGDEKNIKKFEERMNKLKIGLFGW